MTGIEPLAVAVMGLALADLHNADERISASARSFFADADSTLSHWCHVLNLDASAVAAAVKRLSMSAEGGRWRSGMSMRAVIGRRSVTRGGRG